MNAEIAFIGLLVVAIGVALVAQRLTADRAQPRSSPWALISS